MTITGIHSMPMISLIGLNFILEALRNTWCRDTADIITRYVQWLFGIHLSASVECVEMYKKKTQKCCLCTTKPHNLYGTRSIDTFLFTFFHIFISVNDALPPSTAVILHSAPTLTYSNILPQSKQHINHAIAFPPASSWLIDETAIKSHLRHIAAEFIITSRSSRVRSMRGSCFYDSNPQHSQITNVGCAKSKRICNTRRPCNVKSVTALNILVTVMSLH